MTTPAHKLNIRVSTDTGLARNYARCRWCGEVMRELTGESRDEFGERFVVFAVDHAGCKDRCPIISDACSCGKTLGFWVPHQEPEDLRCVFPNCKAVCRDSAHQHFFCVSCGNHGVAVGRLA